MDKRSPFRFLLVVIPVALIIVIAFFVRKQMAHIAGMDLPTPQVIPVSTELQVPDGQVVIDPGMQKSIDAAVQLLKQNDPGFSLYEVEINNVEYSADGETALVWLATLDPETGEVIAREPEIAVAKLNPEGQKGSADRWGVVLPYDSEYSKTIDSIPSGLMGDEFKQRYQTKYASPKVVAKFGGYYLPWGGGLKKRLTWSIGHQSCSGSDCKYAFDFADGTMFPIQAAKGGQVFAAQWTCANGTTKCTNYLILKDNSTTPVSYQMYYHLAANSIPAAYRKTGALVNQGAFIGNTDDTGSSTAHHLHFMVHTNPYGYWGQSVDITFKDVKINYDTVTKGGRPRMPSEATKYGGQGQTEYVSGNRPANGPTGSISAPLEGAVLTSRILVVSGTGKDDKGVTKVQLLANYNNTWHVVGAPITTVPFSFNVDVCATGSEIPDGPVSLALQLWDVEGNQSVGLVGLRGIIKNYACSTAAVLPPCVPASDQVAVYSGPNYTGACKVFSAGDYTNPAAMKGLSGDDAASVLVGDNAQITMWVKAGFTNRGETLVLSDPDLADNLINRDSVNSFKVRIHAQGVSTPVISYPTSGVTTLTNQDSISLYWLNTGWADEFQAEISGNNGFVTRTGEWGKATSWNLGSLPAGTYAWKVRGRNNANHGVSVWATASFTVKAGTYSAGTIVTAPWMDTMESGANGWTASGLWKQTTTKSSSATHSWLFGETINGVLQYATGMTGSLTSPSVKIPSSGYFLHFVYRYNTEGQTKYWDQRTVQVSADGGPFVNVAQLYWDPENTWLQSPAIDLGPYANKNIRVRFNFNTIDPTMNVGDGWYIDNVLIDQSGPASGCNEPIPNNSIASASTLTTTNPISGDICAAGDVDFIKYNGRAGERVTFDLDAKTIGSALDSVLSLYNRDGQTVLAENDDEVAFEVKDSRIFYVLPTTGDYYLKVQAWDHPMVGGANYHYTLKAYIDNAAPVASITYPKSGTLLPNAPFNISISGSDANGSGIGHVVFYWHNSDWDAGIWQKIGEDWNGTDGWNLVFDPTKEPKAFLGAIYVQVFDGSGNWVGTSSWSLKTDPTQPPPPVPTSTIIPMAPVSNINAVLLQWTATDIGPGIAGYEIQYMENGSAWQDWKPEGLKPTDRYAWFIGKIGSNYGFRMRVVDNVGNKETWNSTPETVVTISGCTTGYDVSESDNSQSSAKANEVGGDHVVHTFCGAQDEDWMKFTAVNGEIYFINGLSMSKAVGAVLTVYNAAGNAIGEQFPAQAGAPTTLRWTAPSDGTYFVKARNLNPLLAGDGASYQMWVDQGMQFYIPMVLP